MRKDVSGDMRTVRFISFSEYTLCDAYADIFCIYSKSLIRHNLGVRCPHIPTVSNVAAHLILPQTNLLIKDVSDHSFYLYPSYPKLGSFRE